jgi:hypothetical protein
LSTLSAIFQATTITGLCAEWRTENWPAFSGTANTVTKECLDPVKGLSHNIPRNLACDEAGRRYIALMLPDEQASPEQIAILRRMTPEQRWRAAHRLYWTMRRHKTAFIRSQHPEWPESRVAAEVRDLFCHART